MSIIYVLRHNIPDSRQLNWNKQKRKRLLRRVQRRPEWFSNFKMNFFLSRNCLILCPLSKMVQSTAIFSTWEKYIRTIKQILCAGSSSLPLKKKSTGLKNCQKTIRSLPWIQSWTKLEPISINILKRTRKARKTF